MVTALVINEPATAAGRLASAVAAGDHGRGAGGPIRTAARSGGSTALTCKRAGGGIARTAQSATAGRPR